MRLQRRHYLLIAIVVALGLWNLLHRSYARHSAGMENVHEGPQTPAWQA
jgi:hypothetical protein